MLARPLVGRNAELELLTGALRAASSGRGSVWFLSGEPGIGKSRLAEELADCAAQQGVATFWGRSWEAGGAPAYWPWIQVLRALIRDTPAETLTNALGERAGYLTEVMPELRARLGRLPELPPLDPERKRFELLDALGGALFAACPASGLLVVLEDLHAADASSLGVFDVLGPSIRSSRVLVVGTLRDGDARLSPCRDALEAARAGGRTIKLPRLARADVRALLVAAAGDCRDERACDAIFEATEGNPLFVSEVASLLTGHGVWDQVASSGVALPGSLRATLRRRLETVSLSVRDALAVGSVLGRDFSSTLLAALLGRSMAQLAPALNEALEAGLVIEPAPGEYRFSHVLIRETLHQDLEDARRTSLHLEAAELIQRRRGDATLFSEVAHHYLEAGPAGREGAVDACRRAADAAVRQLAFSDACEWYARALAALGQDSTSDLGTRAELLLSLADAELHTGAIDAGKRTAERAAELARALGDAKLLCRAGLVHGSVLVFAAVDSKLVALLREALAALDPADSPLRAVLTARLAAAEQPSLNPEAPIQMARDALAMARRLGESDVWLETARYAVSAMMDLAPPSERQAINREYVRIAEELEQPLEVLRGRMRLVFDCFELGELASAEAFIGEIERVAARVGHPFYTWRAHSFRAMLAIFQGRFDDAEREMQRARELGERARDPNVRRADRIQHATILKLQGRHAELVEQRASFLDGTHPTSHADVMYRLVIGEALACVGQGASAARATREEDREALLAVADSTLLGRLLMQAEYVGGLPLVTRIEASLGGKEALFASGGMMAMVWEEPISLLRARCAALKGQNQAARALYEEAIAVAERAGSPPYAAWAKLELAELLAAGSGASEPRLRELVADAQSTAEQLGMSGLVERLERLERRSQSSGTSDVAGLAREPSALPPRPLAMSLERDGELFTLKAGDKLLMLRDSKGMQWLAELIARPGEEIHVLDLVAPGVRHAPSDAGELLDKHAVAAYRARLGEIDEELSEAESFNDKGRAAKAQSEREFLEQELKRALGLGDRPRRAGAEAERARINVQRRIRDAMRRIADQDAELGRYLERAVATGTFCCFRP